MSVNIKEVSTSFVVGAAVVGAVRVSEGLADSLFQRMGSVFGTCSEQIRGVSNFLEHNAKDARSIQALGLTSKVVGALVTTMSPEDIQRVGSLANSLHSVSGGFNVIHQGLKNHPGLRSVFAVEAGWNYYSSVQEQTGKEKPIVVRCLESGSRGAVLGAGIGMFQASTEARVAQVAVGALTGFLGGCFGSAIGSTAAWVSRNTLSDSTQQYALWTVPSMLMLSVPF